MAASLNRVLDTLIPEWDQRPPDNPPGGALGFRLRLLMEDSRSIFGESTYSTASWRHNRWKSREHMDYTDQSENVTPRAVSAPEPKHRPDNKMFMSWKVPERVTTGDPSRSHSGVSRSGSMTRKEGIPHAIIPASPPALPAIDSQPTPRPTPRTQSAIPATPRLAPPTPRHPPGTGRLQTGASGPRPLGSTTPLAPKPSTHKPASTKHKSYKISELLNRYYTPSGSPEEWLANASDADRKLIEKALRLVEREKASKPDTSKALRDWVKGADERDRAVALALAFFQSLSGGDNLVQNGGKKPDKLQNIIEHLKRGHQYPGAVFPPDVTRSEDDHKFRYLRLLSPKTRNQKWLHQTWHHLPPCRDGNPVENRTSIYTEPHRYIPRHYVIHPDLG